MPRRSRFRRALVSTAAGRGPRPVRHLVALALLLTLVTAPLLAALQSVALPASAAAKPRAAEADPLLVHIDQVPDTIPASGTFRVDGTVTNNTDEQWLAINLHLFNSSVPLANADLLAESAAQDPNEYFGDRITETGSFARVEVLEPGQSASFRITVTVEQMGLVGAQAGVYSVGVHAFGDSSTPRDTVADGRARTFVPVVDPGKRQVEVSVVVPVRGEIWFTPEGRLDRVERWKRSLSPGGRLHTLLELDDADVSVSWLVDPAVLAAVSRLAAGNPARSSDPVDSPTESPGTDDPSPTGTTSPSSPDTGTPSWEEDARVTPVHPPLPEGTELSEAEAEVAQVATDWLAEFRDVTEGGDVLALPYGDVDVSAAARHQPGTVAAAVKRSKEVMDLLEIPSRSAIAPRTGLLSAEAAATVPEDTLVLLSDTAFTLAPSAPDGVVDLAGRTTVVTSAAAATGGPGPTTATDPLALRQRLVSEAALRLTSDEPSPVVLVLPSGWTPEDPSRLLEGIESRWLSVAPVRSLAVNQTKPVSTDQLSYSESDAEEELPEYVFSRAKDLTKAAELFENVLTRLTTVVGQASDEAYVSVSEGRRANPQDSALHLSDTARTFFEQLTRITVEVPRAITLTSASGTVGATIVNGIDQPVTVRLATTSDDGLEIDDAGEVQIAPGARHRLLLNVRATRQGRHDVHLLVTSVDGVPLGAQTSLPLRSSIISDKVWGALATAAGLLFVTVTYRIVRRIRGVRAGDPVRPPLPGDDPAPEPEPEEQP
ncbi:MAG: DUF6049 family protein [Nocardioides sp.]|uniref:DUF6049 family protein n=1 Tax=Nocardioides sp. TaxID=35761 RepID=UPI003F047950